ncbi:hypothetical protein [uncultured Clostridium sp.]|uniref:hypothetical protein n=1 Tax=uncultured Clostridium sp. TaxID=59620 RepID=UPI0025FFADAE|nr:hypothetical protein [uncultured Clostridium sp.]
MRVKEKGKKTNEETKYKYVSIKMKILSIIVPVISIIVGLLIWVSYTMSSNIIEKKSTDILDASAKNQAVQIKNWLDNNLQTFNTIKQSIGITSCSTDEMKNILNQYYNFNSNFPQGLYIADMEGNVIASDGSTISLENALESQWFQEGLTHMQKKSQAHAMKCLK